MNKKSNKFRTIGTYLLVLTLASILSLALVFYTKNKNIQSEYFAPPERSFHIEDDTGYTRHQSGWPIRFYTYTTYMPFKPTDDGSGEFNWVNFIIDTAVFIVPTSLILGLVNLTVSKIIKKKK